MKRILLLMLFTTALYSQARYYTTGTLYVTAVDSVSLPASAVTYSSGQAVGSRFIKFASIAKAANQPVIFYDMTIAMDSANTTSAIFDLILLKDTAGLTSPVDGSTFTFPTASLNRIIGVVPFAFTNTYGTTAACSFGSVSIAGVICAPSNSAGNIYAVLVAKGSYKRALGTKIYAMVRFIQ